ncbi:DNA repair exonuclease SbcCD nuclease subunit [Arboricoccus pini]|uniref:DNA repair exonuclease SbcCD nuclease subunit n=1 Tax=Arboricoccus pini TaxID=1963835 RepID=A0A212QUP1_9PROT|nr:DNA repair exonuclease [Arboricoccus pini]SNB63223.1 DNA repair exonuclease SbcCD nuclease subunit [Arboricoccus pini]
MLKLLHTADWQIGAPFSHIAGDAGAVLRDERFAVVRRIAALATAREVDAVLVAGDVFDSNLVEMRTIYRLLDALEGYRGPWVMLPGNHDAALPESVWHRLARLGAPANLHVAMEPLPLALPGTQAVILPAPLTTRHTLDDLSAWMDSASTPEGIFRLGLAHGSIEGYLPDQGEATNPIAADRAERARLDYLALGDWHGTRSIDARTHYAGTPEPDRPKDNDSGNVLLTQIERPGALPLVERVAVGRHRWYRRTLNLTAAEPSAFNDLLGALIGDLGPVETLLLWLRLEGSVDLDGRAALDVALDRWQGRLRHLQLDDATRLAPSESELARLDEGSLLGRTAARLRDLAAGPQGDTATLALRLLWQEQAKGEA